MKYLDELIEVMIQEITVPTSKTYVYLILRGTEIIFVGNTYLSTRDTEKVFNITDIVRNFMYINPMFDDIDKKLIQIFTVKLIIDNNTYTATSDNVYLAYRYPHLLKRLEYDGQYNILPGLLPVYPNNQSANYAANLMVTYSSTLFRTGKYLTYNNGTKTGRQFLYNAPTVPLGGTTTKNTNVKLSDMANYASYGTYTPINNDVDLDDEAVNTTLRGDDGFLHWQDGYSFDVVYRTAGFPSFEIHNLGTFNISDEGSKRIEFETGRIFPIDVCFVCNGALTVHILTTTSMKPRTKYVLTFNVVLNDVANDDYAVQEIILSEFVPADIEKGIYEETVSILGISTFKKIGNFCDKLDGYYLQWQDRLGGIQSQHFNSGSTFAINYDSQEITNYRGEKRNINIQTTQSFEINSDWINEQYYPNYESIYTSPYLILYDVKEDKAYNVILKDKQYTEKTFKNQGRKLFNITLKLEENKKQNIIY